MNRRLVMAVTCVPIPPLFFDLPLRQMMLPFIGRFAGQFTNSCHKIPFEIKSRRNYQHGGAACKHISSNSRAFRPAATYLPALFMATIKPFAALRPKPELASRICELPYDVMSSEEARQIAGGKSVELPARQQAGDRSAAVARTSYSAEVYAKGKENFRGLIREGALRQDPEPCFYLYRQIMGKHSQVGLGRRRVARITCKGIIKKHELTRPDKEDDRVRHIETLNSQTGPVFLAVQSERPMKQLVDDG